MTTNLNENLNPVNSPAAQNLGAVDPYTWGYSNEDGVVTAKKILNFSFNQGSGGTLTLGGTANGNGLMTLKDANGSTIFTGDSQGHHYYNGQGTEQVRVDSSGLHNYNANGTEQIRVDFTGFHAYGTAGTSSELLRVDNTGLGVYNGTSLASFLNGTALKFYTNYTQALQFYEPNGTAIRGQVGINIGTAVTSFNIVGGDDLILEATLVDIKGALFVNGADYKLAVVSTSKGYKSLYTNESPDVWFMDFYKDKPDPLFLEVTEPPYHEIECKDGYTQIWGLRKGADGFRFKEKSEGQYIKNSEFWSTPNKS